MASPSITPFSFNSILVLAASTTLLLSIASAHEFIVGGPTGWIVPPAEDPELYNLWANMNCFHVGDFLNFQNATDSVLVVSSLDKYMQCNTTDPIQELPPGNTVFQFPRHGFFYFISSEVDHCWARQRMTVHVVVMVHQEPYSICQLMQAPTSSTYTAAPPYPYPCGSESGSLSSRHNNISTVVVGAPYGTFGLNAAFFLFCSLTVVFWTS
ncbi:Early nodulin-like protein 1 [Rhynchospora pubera]|uniref:Early nodulin-like protein 1 n=1 Tax=Rhynchospora pubera TaxID=906938 RepID=A0AAV8CIB0_9POAL|nr:Early nodulin-like protein 1 [Rhynchospora pubera]